MSYSCLPLYTNERQSLTSVPCMKACTDQQSFQLKVEGKGIINVRPNVAIVDLGVVTESKDLSKAQEENAATMSAVLRSLQENGVLSKDIQTQTYNIYPQYDYIEGKQVFRDYKVEHVIEVTIKDMDRIGKIIDDAVQGGVNQVSSIKFTVANPSAYYQLALKAAIDDALLKAETVGNKLNIAVYKVPVQIVELGYETGVPITPFMYQKAGTTTPVQTGLIEISARIEAVFAYKPVY